MSANLDQQVEQVNAERRVIGPQRRGQRSMRLRVGRNRIQQSHDLANSAVLSAPSDDLAGERQA